MRFYSTAELLNKYNINRQFKQRVSISQEIFDQVIRLVDKHMLITLDDLFVESLTYNCFPPRKLFNVVSYLSDIISGYTSFLYKDRGYVARFENGEVSLRQTVKGDILPKNDILGIKEDFFFYGV